MKKARELMRGLPRSRRIKMSFELELKNQEISWKNLTITKIRSHYIIYIYYVTY